jgi:glycosyltransferase involved in cell wall biosynthesis
MKLVVMIPAYNEENSIGLVIRQIPLKISGVDDVQILVINDGSIDNTVREASNAGAYKIISHKRNLGLGRTFKDGLNEALLIGADIIVNIDADGQYNGSQITDLIKPILCGRADMVIGDRQIDKLDHMPPQKKIGNKIASWVIRQVTGLPIRDAQTGLRAFSREAALRMTLINANYTYTQGTLIEAANEGLMVEQLPIEFLRRKGDSRLISGVLNYAYLAGKTVLIYYMDSRSFNFFAVIGLFMILLGTLIGGYFLSHYPMTGIVMLFPVLIAALTVLFFIVGFQILIFGFLANILRRQRIIHEEILYQLKKMR